MKYSKQSRAHRITARDQVVAMDHLLRAKMLLACAHRERTLTDLAEEFEQPLSKLHYHVGKLKKAKLLRVSRLEPRAGRPILHYRAIAEAFLLNSAELSEPFGEKLASELRRSLATDVNRRSRFMLYDLDEADRFRVRLLESEDGRPKAGAFEYWKILKLAPGQREALAADLAEVIKRYEKECPAASSHPPFLVHAAFAARL